MRPPCESSIGWFCFCLWTCIEWEWGACVCPLETTAVQIGITFFLITMLSGRCRCVGSGACRCGGTKVNHYIVWMQARSLPCPAPPRPGPRLIWLHKTGWQGEMHGSTHPQLSAANHSSDPARPCFARTFILPDYVTSTIVSSRKFKLFMLYVRPDKKETRQVKRRRSATS